MTLVNVTTSSNVFDSPQSQNDSRSQLFVHTWRHITSLIIHIPVSMCMGHFHQKTCAVWIVILLPALIQATHCPYPHHQPTSMTAHRYGYTMFVHDCVCMTDWVANGDTNNTSFCICTKHPLHIHTYVPNIPSTYTHTHMYQASPPHTHTYVPSIPSTYTHTYVPNIPSTYTYVSHLYQASPPHTYVLHLYQSSPTHMHHTVPSIPQTYIHIKPVPSVPSTYTSHKNKTR